MTTPQTPPNPEILGRMNQMLTGYMVTQALYVVAKLGIADLVEAGPKEIATLANEAGADPQSLFRVMRALASVGVFIEVAPRTFGSTPLAAQLSDRARGSLRNLAIMFGEEMYRAWGNALDSVKSGGPAFPEVFGAGHFEFLETHADAAKTFNAACCSSMSGAESRSWWTSGVATARCYAPCSTVTRTCAACCSTDRMWRKKDARSSRPAG